MKANRITVLAAVALASMLGCAAAKKNTGSGGTNNGGTTNNDGTAASNGGGGGSTNSPGGTSGSGSGGSTSMSSGGNKPSGSGSKPSDNTPSMTDAGPTKPPAAAVEMLDPNVDWTALTLVYAPMYSAFDGMHTFQVPVHVDGATVELKDWQAIPSDAVTFEADPDGGGAIITIVKGEKEITIAAQSGKIGGTALLKVTIGTPDDWTRGQMRYDNGVDFNLPDIDFSQAILDPNWMPPPPPPNLACNNCHSTGAKYFEIQHTPTQAARFSDEDLKTIFTMGKKPPGVGFRVLPDMLGNMTAEEVYAGFHKWDATDEEQKGLIIYLRSLTPTGQGDILLPDGTYVAPGTPLDAGVGGGTGGSMP